MRVHELLQMAVDQGASDLLITVGSPPVLRRHGGLVRVQGPRLAPSDTDGLLQQLLTDDQRESFGKTGELSLSYSVFGTGRFRIQAFRQRGTVSVVMRVIPTVVRPAAQLGLPAPAVELALNTSGLVLVVGGPGSGRTTTLACMVDTINSHREAHLVTLEDPIEFLHRHNRSLVNQREIGSDCATFAVGIRAAIQQTADVIVVCKMDSEAVPLMLAAASNGILVLSAVLAKDAREALGQMLASFPPHQQAWAAGILAETLRGVICQQLVPRIGGDGLVAAFEVLQVESAARDLIRSARIDDLPRLFDGGGGDPHSVPMREALAALAASGEISESEYHARCSSLPVHS